MIQIIDDFLPVAYANDIEKSCYQLRWEYVVKTSFVSDSTYGDFCFDNNTFDYGQFCFTFFATGNDYLSTSNVVTDQREQFNFYSPVFSLAQPRIQNINVTSLLRAKINFLTQRPDAPEYHYNIAHRDSTVPKTHSMVYYINDSDGDTFLFNEFHHGQEPPPKDLTVAQRVTPKKNRALIFESNRLHASSNPRIHKERFVMNLVLEVT